MTRLSRRSSYNQAMRLWLAITIVLMIAPGFALAQTSDATTQALADAPGSQTAAPDPPLKPAESAASANSHPFWDRENVLLFSGVTVFRALDFASTKNFLARGRTEILIPDDIVNNNAGFAALEAAATMTSVGVSYVFHRTGHHKMERWLSIVHMSVTAFGDGRNYALKTKHL